MQTMDVPGDTTGRKASIILAVPRRSISKICLAVETPGATPAVCTMASIGPRDEASWARAATVE